MNEFVKSSRERGRRDRITKKDVFHDDIMKKGHVHTKENKAYRKNQKQKFRQISLDNIDEIDDDDIFRDSY